jgi:hypothetical protein
MNRGILIFAYNNQEIDYVKMAVFAARRATEHLNLPVTLITDTDITSEDVISVFEKIIVVTDNSNQNKRFYDGDSDFKLLNWKNYTRNNAYDLTPYDETLVIDSDFIINSNFLRYCWTQKNDFLIYKDSFDLSSSRETSEFTFISDLGIPFYWATVFFFRKTERIKLFFHLLGKIKENWNYYSKVFYLPTKKFRNDFAFSMAIHMMNGLTEGDFATSMPNKLWFITDKDILLEYSNTRMTFLIQSKDRRYIPVAINKKDIHVMNKFSLMRVINV